MERTVTERAFGIVEEKWGTLTRLKFEYGEDGRKGICFAIGEVLVVLFQ